VKDRSEAFEQYLQPGMAGYVGRYSTPTAHAIRLVKAAGGKAVLAHPWSRGSDAVLTPDRIAELVDVGLDGIEVDHPDHSEEQREDLRKIAAAHDLVVTGSSDYHGTGKTDDFRLGANTTLPEELEKLLGG
jgi:predicted metal-dependent phosphoesterase TrpH